MVKSFFESNKKLLSVIIIIAIFSILVHPGYSTYEGDHHFYIQAVLDKVDPNLYPNETLLLEKQLKFTLFDELLLLVAALPGFDLLLSLFVLNFITRIVHLFAFFKISDYFTKNKLVSLFASIFSLYATSEMGSYTFNLDYLVPRSLSLAFGLLFIAFFLNKKRIGAGIALGLSILMHIGTSLPFLGYFFLERLFKVIKSKKITAFEIVPIIAILAIVGLNLDQLTLATFDPFWQNLIISETERYIFISVMPFWDVITYLNKFIILGLAFLISSKHYHTRTKEAVTLSAIAALLIVGSFIGADLLKLHLVTELMPIRSLMIIYLFIPIFLSNVFYKELQKKPLNFINLFVLFGLTLAFLADKPSREILFIPALAIMSFKRFNKPKFVIAGLILPLLGIQFVLNKLVLDSIIVPASLTFITWLLLSRKKISSFLRNHEASYKFLASRSVLIITGLLLLVFGVQSGFSIEPVQNRDVEFMDMCSWIQENTAIGDVFVLSDPYDWEIGSKIKLSCFRSTFISNFDKGHTYFERSFAIEWKERMDLNKRIETEPAIIKSLKDNYKVDYLISDIEFDLPLLYSNSTHLIYRI